MSVSILGIRHHGPGCARSVVEALEAKPPLAVLIEGPPDANELISAAALAGMTPPVALMIHREDDPKQAVFYPFAEFSPEWQALRWALARGVPVKFMDFPWQHRFPLRDAANAAAQPDDPVATQNVEPPPAASPEEVAAKEREEAIRRDPLRVLAEADGYLDSERWWNDRVEERGDATGMFEAILEAMTSVRQELAIIEPMEELRREAWMRRVLRETQREVLGEIAVVCGAWHAPAISNPPKVAADNELLKGLPKTKVGATWVPWTYQRLCLASGYGAGIQSPGWYEHLWQHRRDPQLTARWLTRIGHVLRGRDLDASTAQVIDSVRLAEHLAAFRGRSIPGLTEMNEAAVSVFCHGDQAPMKLVARELTVGERLGAVPEGVARVPLQQDIEATQKRLRLKPSAAQVTLELDLREPTGLERSHFLHRLELLGIDWGAKQTAASGKGTFKELWRLEWKPEFAVSIIDAARFGNTVELAAIGAVKAEGTDAPLEKLCALLEVVLLADLPDASDALLHRVANEAAKSDDALRLCQAVPPLARLARYGSVRQTDSAAVLRILQEFSARIHAGLPSAVAGIDDDAAQTWSRALRDYHLALGLLETDRIEDWKLILRKLLDAGSTHALIGGLAARLLLESGALSAEEAGPILMRALSRGQEPTQAAAWIEGFLSGQGSILVHDPTLLPLLERWVEGLADDAFMAVLPLVRRTFATFEAPERAKIASRIGQSTQTSTQASEGPMWTLDVARAQSVLPVLGLLLGREFPMRKSS